MTFYASVAARLYRARARVTRSIRLRLVLVFLLLALALIAVFVAGAQRALSVGWREAARPLLMDYVDRLAADITVHGTPSIRRAQALVAHLPLTVQIEGPLTTWSSEQNKGVRSARAHIPPSQDSRRRDLDTVLQRTTADNHVLTFGISDDYFGRDPRRLGYLLTALLFLTFLAWMYVRWLLVPLDEINAGARRFGSGDFTKLIPANVAEQPNELGELAAVLNIMGHDIHQMLEAKRALLLAISHELRGPITRARLNAELLPDSTDVRIYRDALLRDLLEMSSLISDLLESERLAGRHAPLNRQLTNLYELGREVVQDLAAHNPLAGRIRIMISGGPPSALVDPQRVRVLLRNLLDNSLRHGCGTILPPSVEIARTTDGGTLISVRDYGPGVSPAQLPLLSQAFYRPDSARSRSVGGVGLGLYLCRLIAHAHGGTFDVKNCEPGLSITIVLPPTE